MHLLAKFLKPVYIWGLEFKALGLQGVEFVLFGFSLFLLLAWMSYRDKDDYLTVSLDDGVGFTQCCLLDLLDLQQFSTFF